MSFLSSLFAPSRPKARPVQWRKAFCWEGGADLWVGHVGDSWYGTQLFRIKRDEFIETGATYCLHSQLNRDCVSCYATLELAQRHAQEQWENLVREGVTL